MHKRLGVRIHSTLSLLLGALVIFSSSIGLFSEDFYRAETLNWKTQAVAQDIIHLFVVTPLLLGASIGYVRGKKFALAVQVGSLFYLLYTFLIYSFSIHFNSLFLVYCFIVGLSFYSLIFIAVNLIGNLNAVNIFHKSRKAIAIYFIVAACAFYLLWLLQIVPAIINKTVPAELVSVGLFTNPVHVIDLSICLPGIFLTGILLWKRNPIGFFLAPSVLTFMMLMNSTIGFLAWFMKRRGISESAGMVYVMIGMTIISLYFLVTTSRWAIYKARQKKTSYLSHSSNQSI